MKNSAVLLFIMVICLHSPPAHAQIEPRPTDYSKLAFYPERWAEHKVPFSMQAWHGKHVVLLTSSQQFDSALMSRFVDRLDGGWLTYQELIGKSPEPFRQIDNRPRSVRYRGAISPADTVVVMWASQALKSQASMTTTGLRSSRTPMPFRTTTSMNSVETSMCSKIDTRCFTTGYAVFMRYVCMDRLKCTDPELATRQTIERCEEIYANSKISFLDAFTNLTNGEKGNRLTDPVTGQTIFPSDQPVMYATAMLKLRKDNGGDEFVRDFFRHLHKCPAVNATSEETALQQSMNWLVSASAAASKDLSPVFADRWRMPLSAKQRKLLAETQWKTPTSTSRRSLRN